MQKHYALPRKYVTVGEFLYEARKKAKLTQREVSLALDYSSAQFISNFERGIAIPPLKKMKTLQRLYRMDVDKLVELIVDSERIVMAGILVSKKKSKVQ